MGSIRAGGIVSGIQTNTIIEELVNKAKEPIVDLQNRNYLLDLEKKFYKDINNDLLSFKNLCRDLRMESTFKSKKGASSNMSVLNAKVNFNATAGVHTFEVLQVAKNSKVDSKFLSTILYSGGCGVTGVANAATTAYDQEEGRTVVQVEQNSYNRSVASSYFYPDSNKQYSMQTFGEIPAAFMDKNGVIALDGEENIKFQLNIPGKGSYDMFNIKVDFSTVKDINEANNIIERELNEQINAHLGTNFEQYLNVRAIYDSATDTWRQAIYYTGTSGLTVVPKDATGAELAGKMGMTGEVQESKTTFMQKFVAADNHEELAAKLKERKSTLIYNVPLTIEASGLKDGIFQLHQDATMNVQRPCKAAVISREKALNPVSTGDILDQTLAEAGLANNIDGTVTINGVKIKFEDTADKTVKELMAMVNSSGAGVKVYYNDQAKFFVMERNENGDKKISYDTSGSSFFDAFGLSSPGGAVELPGSDGGKVSTQTPIAKGSGFTSTPRKGVFTINDVPIYIDPEKESLNDLITKVNSSAANVIMSYDENTDKIHITSKNTDPVVLGSSRDTSDVLAVFNLTPQYNVAYQVGANGQPAIINYEGTTYYRDSNEVSDLVPGMDLKITGKGFATVEVDIDTDKGLNAVANFIQKYNSLVKQFQTETISSKERADKMKPLTEEKKKGMSDEEVKNYLKEYDRLHSIDIKDRSSEIRGLSTSMRYNLMSHMFNNQSKFKTLVEIGINIAGGDEGNYNLSKKGYLVIESTDLEEIKKALTDNTKFMDNLRHESDELYKFFGVYNDDLDSQGIPNEKHIDCWARRFEKIMDSYSAENGIIGNKIKVKGAIDMKQKSIEDQITLISSRAEDYLERLWRDFTAMEQRIAQINKQAEYIAKISAQTK